MDLDCGPIVNKKQFNRIQQIITEASAGGIPVIARGQLAEGLAKEGLLCRASPVRTSFARPRAGSGRSVQTCAVSDSV
jgi:type III secretory pathway component EscU